MVKKRKRKNAQTGTESATKKPKLDCLDIDARKDSLTPRDDLLTRLAPLQFNKGEMNACYFAHECPISRLVDDLLVQILQNILTNANSDVICRFLSSNCCQSSRGRDAFGYAGNGTTLQGNRDKFSAVYSTDHSIMC